VTFRPFINFSNDAMAVKSRDNVFDKPFKMLDLLRNAKWENSFLSKIALFTHSLKKVIPTFKEILSVSKTKNWCLLQNIIPTFLLKTFEFISFIIKGRDNKKVVITILPTTLPEGVSVFRLLRQSVWNTYCKYP
jgi:hypothetical protein